MTATAIRFRRLGAACRSALTLVSFLAVAIVGGCSSHELDTAKVHGTVTLDGQPLETGLVFFQPEKGRMAVGKIQSDGSYALFTYVRNGDDGAIVGRHKVSVVPPIAEGELEAIPEMKRPIPACYQSAGTSKLEYVVEAGKDNVINIELSESAGKPNRHDVGTN
jgi:hypothetical protein